MSCLPKGWAFALVGDVLRLRNGFAFKPALWSTAGLPIVRIQNLNDHSAGFNHFEGEVGSSFKVASGDLLFAWSGTPGTSFGAHIWSRGDAWLNQHIYRVDFSKSLFDPTFLKHAINQNLDHYIDSAHGGAGLAHITKGKFEASSLKFPHLAEQRRIVAKLDGLLARVRRSQQRLEKVPKILKRFRQAVLTAACEGKLTADCRGSSNTLTADEVYPVTWSCTTFGDVVADSFYGPRFGADAYVTSYGIPTVRTSDMTFDGRVVLSDPPRLSLSTDQLRKYGLRDGDLLVTRTGATIGKCALYERSLGPAIPSAYLIRFRLKEEKVHPKFALFFLMSPKGQEQLVRGATAVAQPNVNATTICQFQIPLPPMAEQHEIVTRVTALVALADRLATRCAEGMQHVEKLTTSILDKAFRGELVPTEAELAEAEGRTYESAEQLLERIRTEGNGNHRAARKPMRSSKPAP